MSMATKQKVKITKTRYVKKNKSGYRKCNMCHGTGRVKVKS